MPMCDTLLTLPVGALSSGTIATKRLALALIIRPTPKRGSPHNCEIRRQGVASDVSGRSSNPRGPAAFALVLFLLLPALALVVPAAQAANPGDWVVAGSQTLDNGTRFMNGSIIVPAGAVLTVRNSTIAFDLPSEGKYNITVEEGGSLRLEDSTVRSNVTGMHYNFVAAGHLEVRRTDISDMRGDVGLGGLESSTGNMIMEDSVIHHNRYYGLFLRAGSAVVRRTVFESNVVAVTVLPGATPTLEDLIIRNSTGFGLKVSSASPSVRNLTVTGSSSFAVGVISSNFSIAGCHIVGGTVGIDLVLGSSGGITGCEILNTGTGVRAQDSSFSVVDTSFSANGVGINSTRSRLEITGNRFVDAVVGVRVRGPVEGAVGGSAETNSFRGTGTAFEVYLATFFVQGNTYEPGITSLRVFHDITLVVVDKAGKPVAQAHVNFTALGGARVFTGVTNETGVAVATVEDYREFGNGTRTNFTPHEVTITRGDQLTETTVNATADRIIQVTLANPDPPTTNLGIPRDALVIIGIAVAVLAMFLWAAARSTKGRRAKPDDAPRRPSRRRGPRSGR